MHSQAQDTAPAVIPKIARQQIVSLAKLVIDYAFQPIVEINTGFVYGYEALMRGYDRLNLNAPKTLLDHAFESGVLVELEQMLHGRAIAKFATVPEFQGKKLFLNIDGRALHAGQSLLEGVTKIVQRSQIPVSAICFELSEQFDNASVAEFSAVVDEARRLGVRLAIDDFGLGFSELKLLCDYGLDFIKIDGHFIRDIGQNQRKKLFVTTITNLAHVLGIRVIAEGVETEAEYIACRAAGCDLVQGYFVSQPTVAVKELLPSYSHVVVARAKHRRDRKTDELLVRTQMAAVPAIRDNTTLDVVFDIFRRTPQESFFPVVDAADHPHGIIHERDLKKYIYMPFGRDLLHNRSYHRGLASFVSACPIVDINTDAERILEIFANARGSDGVILTENLRYVGVLSASALLTVMNEKQLQQAQDQNPLTELPGNLSITDYVAVTALDGDQRRHFCYFDFDNFKPFNDRYGFAHGDRAISLFAMLMRRHAGAMGAFLGHIGGDDFFIGMSGRSADEVETLLTTMLEEFRVGAAKLYSDEDQRAGCTSGIDRDGRTRCFNLMRCSVAVIELPAGLVTSDLDRIHALIAQGKREAKRSERGYTYRQMAT